MRKEKTFQKQGFMQGVLAIIFSQVLIKLLGLVYKLYINNREGFGDEGMGIYNSGFQIYALLLTLSSIGVPSAIAKLVSERVAMGNHKGAHRIFKIAFVTFAIVGLLGTLILFFGARYIANVVIGMPEAEYTLIALSPSIFFVAIASVIRGYFNGRENLKITANSQTLEQIFKTVLTIGVVEIIAMTSSTNTVFMAAGANLATTLATLLSFGYIYLYYVTRREEVWKEIDSSVNYKYERIKTILAQILWVSIPISLSSLMSAVNKNIDTVTVVRGLQSFMSAKEAREQYGILGGKVDTLTSLPLSFNIAFATALVPAIASAMIKGEKETARKRVSFSLMLTMLIGLPCTVGMAIFSEQIIGLLYPNAPQGAMILQISAFAILFTCLAQTINGALQGLGKVIIPAIALGTGVAIKLILNLILVPMPQFGANGAAFASVVCHIISFTIGYIVIRKHIPLDLRFSKFVVKPIIATIMMAIVSYFAYIKLSLLLSSNLAFLIAMLIAVIIYILSILILHILSKEDIYMIPYGQKFYELLEKMGIYKQEQT